MTITVTEDEAESGGYALVDLGVLASAPVPRLSIRRRDAEPRHLGLDGWQPEACWLTPLSAESIGGRTVVRLGPDIVDRIPDEIGIEIVEEGGRSFGVAQWPYITPAPQGASVTIRQKDENAGNRGATPGSTETVAPPEPEPPAPAPVDLASLRDAIAAPAPPQASLVMATKAPRRRRGRIWIPSLLLLLVVAAGGAAWHYRDRLPWPVPTPGARIERAEMERRYASLLQRRASPGELVAFGNEALAGGQAALAFRAFEEADPATSEEAAWQLSRFYDPRISDETVRATAAPNPIRAAYYLALWKGRSARHSDELRALCSAVTDPGERERVRVFCEP